MTAHSCWTKLSGHRANVIERGRKHVKKRTQKTLGPNLSRIRKQRSEQETGPKDPGPEKTPHPKKKVSEKNPRPKNSGRKKSVSQKPSRKTVVSEKLILERPSPPTHAFMRDSRKSGVSIRSVGGCDFFFEPCFLLDLGLRGLSVFCCKICSVRFFFFGYGFVWFVFWGCRGFRAVFFGVRRNSS